MTKVMHSRRYAAALVSLLTGATGCSGGGSPASPPTPPNSGKTLQIAVSRSTNTDAYTIVLADDAVAIVTLNGATQRVPVPAADAARFFTDAGANVPVNHVATTTACPKSASFGTTTLLTYDGSTSGDISCPPAPASAAATLYADEQRIASDIEPTIPLNVSPVAP